MGSCGSPTTDCCCGVALSGDKEFRPLPPIPFVTVTEASASRRRSENRRTGGNTLRGSLCNKTNKKDGS